VRRLDFHFRPLSSAESVASKFCLAVDRFNGRRPAGDFDSPRKRAERARRSLGSTHGKQRGIVLSTRTAGGEGTVRRGISDSAPAAAKPERPATRCRGPLTAGPALVIRRSQRARASIEKETDTIVEGRSGNASRPQPDSDVARSRILRGGGDSRAPRLLCAAGRGASITPEGAARHRGRLKRRRAMPFKRLCALQTLIGTRAMVLRRARRACVRDPCTSAHRPLGSSGAFRQEKPPRLVDRQG